MTKKRKQKLKTDEVWTEEELADYLGFEYIAGFTEGGAPFGIEKDESENNSTVKTPDSDDELPF